MKGKWSDKNQDRRGCFLSTLHLIRSHVHTSIFLVTTNIIVIFCFIQAIIIISFFRKITQWHFIFNFTTYNYFYLKRIRHILCVVLLFKCPYYKVDWFSNITLNKWFSIFTFLSLISFSFFYKYEIFKIKFCLLYIYFFLINFNKYLKIHYLIKTTV